MKIYYIVGAYGCGKTTAVKNLSEKYKLWDILEDYIILHYLKSPNMLMKSSFYMFSYFYRLQTILMNPFLNINIICDSHPMVPFFYLQARFEMEYGFTVDLRDLFYFGKLHNQMVKESEKIFLENENIVFHLDLPLEENWKRVIGRIEERKEFSEEADMDYLISVRRAIDQHIKIYTEETYHSEYVKVKSVEEIEERINNTWCVT